VAPAEVEQEIAAIAGVAAAHVVAVDDAERGQIVGAAVVLEEGVTLDAPSIVETLRPRLSSYKVPRLLVFLSQDEVPVTPSRKIAKQDLARLIQCRSAGHGQDTAERHETSLG
jgi:acyl-coenzyme A synthetase/AMP-(fatty) acid ligase